MSQARFHITDEVLERRARFYRLAAIVDNKALPAPARIAACQEVEATADFPAARKAMAAMIRRKLEAA